MDIGDSSAASSAPTAEMHAPSTSTGPGVTAGPGAGRIISGLQHLQTCSDDEEYHVFGGATESEPGTDELMGQVDWSLPCGSDDEVEPQYW